MVPMVKNSLIFLGCLCLLFSCRTVKVVGGNNYNGDVTKLKAEMDSLIQNYGNNPEACIQVLNLASYSEDYLPDSNLYRDLERLEYFYEYGNILECVGDEIKAGNRKAESVMIQYLTNYYNSIEEKGFYDVRNLSLFAILWDMNDSAVLPLIEKMALDNSDPKNQSNDEIFCDPDLVVTGQLLSLARIKSINGLTSFSSVFGEAYNSYTNSNTNCSRVDRWKKVVLPILNEAIESNTIEYLESGFSGDFNPHLRMSDSCR